MASYHVEGRKIMREGAEYISAQRPDMAEQMADIFNEIASYERLDQAKPEVDQILLDWLGSDQLIGELVHALSDPQHFTLRLQAEPTQIWLARAVVVALARLSMSLKGSA